MNATTFGPTQRQRQVPWRLVGILAAVALVRPLLSITGLAEEWGKPATPLLATLAVTGVWIGAVLVTRQPDPVRTLVVTGVVYGLFASVLSGVLSPILDGDLHGPLTNPFALLAMLAVNAAWGLVAGSVAVALRRPRRR